MLELMIASAMLATLLAAISLVLRTGRAAWDAQEADFARIEAGHATVRHIVRQIRQARRVQAISDPWDTSGSLSLVDTNDVVLAWSHDEGTGRVLYGINTANQLLAPEISGLRFEGLQADGVTPATSPADVQLIRVEVTLQLPRENAGGRTIGSWAWMRTW